MSCCVSSSSSSSSSSSASLDSFWAENEKQKKEDYIRKISMNARIQWLLQNGGTHEEIAACHPTRLIRGG